MFNIIFKSDNCPDIKTSAEKGANLLETALLAGVLIDSPCAGAGTCGKCKIKILSGTLEYEKNIHLSDKEYSEGYRLACQCRIVSDAEIYLPSSLSAFKSDIKTASLSSRDELERYSLLLSKVFNSGIKKDESSSGFGLAVDIGTTTVSAVLIDLKSGYVKAKASAGNAQIRYGADVINRIIASSKEGGRTRLKKAVREETILPLISSLCNEAEIEPEKIIKCVIAGNTTMEHLFVGEDAQSIRLEPYVPKFLELHGKTAADVGLPISESAPVIFAPNVGSYVGGDITAGTLMTLIWNSEELSLFIDLGTNGEIVFGNKDFLLCCACSAGPAFEGGDISCGMRATDGAIESCAIDENSMEPVLGVIANVPPAGICGSGLIDLISELFRTGIINAKGKFVKEGARIKHDEYMGSSYVVAFASQSADGKDIEITETDIDNFIRAKAAIFSAVRTLLSSLDMSVDMIEKIYIAGGIGSGINISKAIKIGMLPNVEERKYSYIGNSSLSGACAMLLSKEAENKVFETASNMTYIELSTYPGYMEEFIAACFLPHTNALLFD